MRALCHNPLMLAALTFCFGPETISGYAIHSRCGGVLPEGRFRRNVVGLFADIDEGKGSEQAGKTETEKSTERKHDMTDRFKYKVNALMGTYDPQIGADDERQDGNILMAMLSFPARYTFNAVGKTNGDEAIREEYVQKLKQIVLATSGDEDAKWEVLPRGEKFTKVQCEVEVQSVLMIGKIYDEISNLERTVMRF